MPIFNNRCAVPVMAGWLLVCACFSVYAESKVTNFAKPGATAARVSQEQAKIDILFIRGGKISDVFREGLVKHGFRNLQICPWDEITPELLARSRCVMVFSLLRLSFSKKDEYRFKLIEEYVSNGGGLLLTQSVGQMLASSLLSVIGDINDFRSAKQLAAYIGIVPRVSDSNETVHHGTSIL